MPTSLTRSRSSHKGFSILEMMLATIILLVGLVAIAQLVPASILLNYRNRTDSAALVFAQGELDQMLDQPLTLPSFTDTEGNACNLGIASNTTTFQGSPLTVFNNQTIIDFTAAPVTGYSFNYQDLADPRGTTYDVRWAVLVSGNGTTINGKRFVLGVRQFGGSGYFQPVTIDTMVQK